MKNKKNQVQKNTKNDIVDKLTEKKLKNKRFKELSKLHKSESGRIRIEMCCDFVETKANKDLTVEKVVNCNCCKDRFCPICSGFKARKEAYAVLVMMNYIKNLHSKEFIFLTLTAPNVKADGLEDEIKDFNLSFQRLTKLKGISAVNKGYVRKTEVTYNKDLKITQELYFKQKDYFDIRNLKIGDDNPNYNTYHVHFHVIIAVNKSYFTDKTYIKQSDWLKYWQDSKRDSNITQVDVKRIKDSDDTSYLEIAKYSAKDIDYLINQEVFDVFYKALKGKRLLVYNGLFKKAMTLFKEYKKIKDKSEKEKHILHQFIEIDTTEYIYMILYRWGYGKYIEQEKRTLIGEEKKKLNSVMIDEIEVDST